MDETLLQACIQDHLDYIDDYLGTIRGLYALCISAAWDEDRNITRPDAKWCVPRRMDMTVVTESRESNGAENQETIKVEYIEVTPDAVVQPSREYGLVIEAKKNFSDSYPESVFRQIAKYDTDLRGWWTEDENIKDYDLVLLTHMISSVGARDAYRKWLEDNPEYEHQFSIIEYSYTETGKLWLMLRKIEGAISDPIHDEHLRKGKKISDDILMDLFAKWKFSEHDPPLMHMLLLLHDYILPLLLSETEFEEESETGRKGINTTVPELRDRLAEQFCPYPEDARHFALPKTRWVQDAVDSLEAIGLAKKRSEGEGYKIVLRPPRTKSTIEYFARELLKVKKREASDEGQRELFEEVDN